MQPTVINFKNVEKMPDGTQQHVNNTLSISQMEQTMEASKSINEVCGLINNGDNDQAFMILSKLKDQGKIQFQINKGQMANQVENAEQQITQAKWGTPLCKTDKWADKTAIVWETSVIGLVILTPLSIYTILI